MRRISQEKAPPVNFQSARNCLHQLFADTSLLHRLAWNHLTRRLSARLPVRRNNGAVYICHKIYDNSIIAGTPFQGRSSPFFRQKTTSACLASDIVVGQTVETGDLCPLIAQYGEHQNRDAAVLSDFFQDLNAGILYQKL